jgi:hypothetical protein
MDKPDKRRSGKPGGQKPQRRTGGTGRPRSASSKSKPEAAQGRKKEWSSSGKEGGQGDRKKPGFRRAETQGQDKRPAFRNKEGQGDGKPSFRSREGQGERKPSFRSRESQGDSKPSFRSREGQGDRKPPFRRNEEQGDGKPSFRSREGQGDSKPSFRSREGQGERNPRGDRPMEGDRERRGPRDRYSEPGPLGGGPRRTPNTGGQFSDRTASGEPQDPQQANVIEYPLAFEANPLDTRFLQSYKMNLRKHLSLRKPSTLHEEVVLAVFLIALGRSGEALQIVTFLGHNFEYSNDIEQWQPVALGICLQARLLREANRNELAVKAMQKLAAQPFLTMGKEELSEYVRSAPEKLATAFADKAIKTNTRVSGEILLILMALAELSRFDKTLLNKEDSVQIEETVNGALPKLDRCLRN